MNLKPTSGGLKLPPLFVQLSQIQASQSSFPSLRLNPKLFKSAFMRSLGSKPKFQKMNAEPRKANSLHESLIWRPRSSNSKVPPFRRLPNATVSHFCCLGPPGPAWACLGLSGPAWAKFQKLNAEPCKANSLHESLIWRPRSSNFRVPPFRRLPNATVSHFFCLGLPGPNFRK